MQRGVLPLRVSVFLFIFNTEL